MNPTSDLTLSDWNWAVLMLTQAMIGAVSPNFRLVELAFEHEAWVVRVMATVGLGSLSSVVADEIVLAEVDSTELTDGPADAFESRINALLGRDDLRSVQLRRVERDEIPAGLSFQEFQKAYLPPRLIFACPRCNADATAIRTESIQGYERAGGTIRLIGDLTLR